MMEAVKSNLGLSVGLFLVIADLFFMILAFAKNTDIEGRIFFFVILIVLLWWFSPRFIDLMTDIMIPRFLQGRKIHIDTEGGYETLRMADSLSLYLVEKGAIITDVEQKTEFHIVLKLRSTSPLTISCVITDPTGCQQTFQAYSNHWPKPVALRISTFIKRINL